MILLYTADLKFAINFSRHESIGYYPAFMNFGRELVVPKSLRQEAKMTDQSIVTEPTKNIIHEDYVQRKKTQLGKNFGTPHTRLSTKYMRYKEWPRDALRVNRSANRHISTMPHCRNPIVYECNKARRKRRRRRRSNN